MARFYGFGHEEIESMQYESFLAYVKAIDGLRAKETLMNIQIASFPNAKKEYKDKIHRDLIKTINSENFEKPKNVLTTEDIARMLNGRR